MNLFEHAEDYDAHPPHTWTVKRVSRGLSVEYRVMIDDYRWADAWGTRADAQRIIDRPDSWLRRKYETEKAAAHASNRAAVLA